MKNLLRWLARLVIWGGTAVVSLILVVVLLADAPGALRWMAEIANEQSGGAVTIVGLSGHPLSELRAQSIRWHNHHGLTVVVHQPHLVWNARALLYGRVHTRLLTAHTIEIIRQPDSSPKEPTAPWPDSWWEPGFRLDSLEIKRVIWRRGQSVQTISPISVANLRWGRRVTGSVFVRQQERLVRLTLGGVKQNWQATTRLTQPGQPEINGQASGNRLQRGKFEVAVAGLARLSGQWQADKKLEQISADGQLSVSKERITMSGHWRAESNLVSGYGLFDLYGQLAAPAYLSRPLPLRFTLLPQGGVLRGTLMPQDGVVRGTLHLDGSAVAGNWRIEKQEAFAQLRLNQWHPPLAVGDASLSGTADLFLAWPLWRLVADLGHSQLRGEPVALQTSISGSSNRAVIEHLKGEVAGATLEATGPVSAEQINLHATLRASQLNRLAKAANLPQLGGGRVEAEFTAVGPTKFGPTKSPNSPKIIGKGRLVNLRWGEQQVGQLDWTASGSLKPQQGEAEVGFRQALLGGKKVAIGALTARLTGPQLELTTSGSGQLGWSGVASANLADRSGQLRQCRLSLDARQMVAADILLVRWPAGGFSLAPANVVLAGFAARVAGSLAGERIEAKVDLPATALRSLAETFGPVDGLTFGSGEISGQIAFGGTLSAPQASFELATTTLTLSGELLRNHGQPLTVGPAKLSGGLANNRFSGVASLSLPGGGLASGTVAVPLILTLRPWRVVLPTDHQATLTLTLPDLKPVEPWLPPAVSPLAGSFALEMRSSGRLADPLPAGQVVLTLSKVGLPELGVEYHGNATIHLQGKQGRLVSELASADGGWAKIENQFDWPAPEALAVRLHHFPVSALADRRVKMSGTLNLVTLPQGAEINGDLVADELRLALPPPLPKPTADLLWQQEQPVKPESAALAKAALRIAVDAGEHAEITGRGMQLSLRGKLVLGGSVESPSLKGVLTLPSGQVRFRDMVLAVQPGSQVIFSGPINRPQIDLRLGRQIGDVTVGVWMQGAADNLKTALYSTPAMTDAEILSWLATGRPLQTLGNDNVGDAMTAAGFLFGTGSQLEEIQGKMRRGLGLDTLALSAGGENGGAVTVGKKLGNRTTVTFEQSLAKQGSAAVTVEYLLFSSLTAFARQVSQSAPLVGLRYAGSWYRGGKQPQ